MQFNGVDYYCHCAQKNKLFQIDYKHVVSFNNRSGNNFWRSLCVKLFPSYTFDINVLRTGKLCTMVHVNSLGNYENKFMSEN